MSAPAVRTEGLTKDYGTVRAVDDISIRVEPGEVYGFLGRNGAGKTTTIRLLLGMLRPSAGQAEILGTRVGPGRAELWRRVGYLVERATAYPELTVRENLDVARTLQGVKDRAVVARSIERLRLAPYADRRARTLSTGNLQRLALARALLHRPDLVILDEPTTGLDPAGVVEVREMLRSLVRDDGVTVFMSSHILSEVERVATRIGIVHEGRLVSELSAAELDGRRERRLEIGFGDRRPGILAKAESALRDHGFQPRPAADGLVLIEPDAVRGPDRIAEILVAADAPPSRLVVAAQDMESFFLSLTGEEDR